MTEKVNEIEKQSDEIAEEKRLERNRKAREYYKKRKIDRILSGEIAAYLKMGKKPVEIARLLGRHRSTICREIKCSSVNQVQDKNGKRT